MNKREQHARKLMQAAATLDPIDLTKDSHPQINLQSAYDAGMEVWRAMASYGSSQERGGLRISLLAVRTINQAIEEGRRVFSEDNSKIKQAAEQFRAVALRVCPHVVVGRDDKSETRQFSPIGLRMRSLKDLAGAKPYVELPSVQTKKVAPPLDSRLAVASDDAVADDMHRIEALQKFRSKLPATVKPGDPFVAVRMPVLVYTKVALNTKSLNRVGVQFFELRNFGPPKDTATVDKKLAREKGWAYVFENQLVIGMRPDEVADSRKRPKAASSPTVVTPNREKHVPFKTLDSRMRKAGLKVNTDDAHHLSTTVTDAQVFSYGPKAEPRYVVRFKDGSAVEGTRQKTPVVMSREVVRVPGAASRAVAAVSKKLGPHTNPLSTSHPAEGLIRSPGSHLSFMWLVSDHELSAIGSLVISGASFPWRQLESADQRQHRLADAEKELKNLQEQQNILAKHKRVLEPEKIARISQLREMLDRSKSEKAPLNAEQKRARLEQLKAELDAEVQRKNANLFKEIEELREDLEDEEDEKAKRVILRKIKAVEAAIARSRDVLSVKYRNRI